MSDNVSTKIPSVEEATSALMHRIDELHLDLGRLVDPRNDEARVSHWGDGGKS